MVFLASAKPYSRSEQSAMNVPIQMAEAPALRPGLRMPSRCKGANQNNTPGTPKELARPKPKNAAFQNRPLMISKSSSGLPILQNGGHGHSQDLGKDGEKRAVRISACFDRGLPTRYT